MEPANIKDVVKEKYGEAALRVNSGGSACCGATAAGTSSCDPITSNLYDAVQSGEIPEEALLASLGCGNPTALANLHAGETVLDLGSGGGIGQGVLLRRVVEVAGDGIAAALAEEIGGCSAATGTSAGMDA